MNQILTILFLLLTTQSYAANIPQAASVIQPGGAPSQTGSGANIPFSAMTTNTFVRLCASNNSMTQNDFYSFYSLASPTTSSAYQVPSGKTFYGLSVDMIAGNGDTSMLLATNTAQFTENAAAASQGGTITYFGSSNTGTGSFTSGTANAPYNWNVAGLSFPSNSWIAVRSANSTDTVTICITGIVQ